MGSETGLDPDGEDLSYAMMFAARLDEESLASRPLSDGESSSAINTSAGDMQSLAQQKMQSAFCRPAPQQWPPSAQKPAVSCPKSPRSCWSFPIQSMLAALLASNSATAE